MADENKTFMEESQEYADKYKAAIKEGYDAFIDISTELIARGIKTKDQIIADAQQFGIDVKEAVINKALEAKGVVLDVTGKVVQAGKDAKDWVDGKVEAAEQWVGDRVQDGKDAVRAGRDAVVRGYTNTKNAVVQGYKDTKEAVVEGYEAAAGWVGDKVDAGLEWVEQTGDKIARGTKTVVDKTGKAIRTGAAMGMGAVLLGADVTIKGVKKVGEKVGEKGQEIGKAAVSVKNQAVAKAQSLWGKVKQGYKDTRAAVVKGYNATRDAVVEGYETATEWVGDRVQDGKDAVRAGKDAVVHGYEKASEWVGDRVDDGKKAVRAGRDAVVKGYENTRDAVVEGYEAAAGWVGDKVDAGLEWAEQTGDKIARGTKTVVDKTGKAIRTGAAMGMGAVLLGADVTIKGVRKVGEKGQEIGQEIGKAAVSAKNQAVAKAKGLWGRVKQGYRDTKEAVVEGYEAAAGWVGDRVQDGKDAVRAGKEAVVEGYEAATKWAGTKVKQGREFVDKTGRAIKTGAEDVIINTAAAMETGYHKVKGKAEDIILDAGIAIEDGVAAVKDGAETVAIGAMLAGDKIKDVARTGAAMGMGAILLGKDVVVRGAKTVGEKGQEIGKAAVQAKDQAVAKAKGLWGRVKQGYRDTKEAVVEGYEAAAGWVGDRVQDGKDAVRAGKDAVVKGYTTTRDAVVQGYETAEQWVGDKVEAGKNAVKDARTNIAVRTDLGISSLAEGVSGFFGNLSGRLAEQALSRKERAEKTRAAREAEKNQVKGQTGPEQDQK